MSALPTPTSAAGPWWRRLHTALMHDYNRRAATAWWTFALLGAGVLLLCLAQLASKGWVVWLQVLAGTALAIAAGLFPVRVPGTKNAYAAGEISIFLLLLMLGPAAAAVAAACEGFVASHRTSKRWTSRLFTPASATLSMWLAGSLLQMALASLAAAGWSGAAVVLGAAMVFSTLYFFINSTLIAGVLQLKRGERFFQPAGVFSVFRWVGMAYAGSASLAALLFFAYQQQGVGALLTMTPLLVVLLMALHFFFRQQEEAERLRSASVEVAEREARLAEREAEVAARHLRELQASERRFQSAFTHASIGMALLAFDGRVLLANPALAALLGQDADALKQARFQHLVLSEDRPRIERQLGLTHASEFEGFATEVRCQHAEGSPVWLMLHCSFFTDPDAAEPCLILQAQDVTARRSAEAGLAHMAFHDSLTGLPNRRRFLECLAGAVARSKADPQHVWAVMFLDFDRFKLVNDSLGHNAGDDLLQQLARRLQEKLRPSDTVARLGGDEFAILADHIEHERDAVVLAERLMDALCKPFLVAGNDITASASVGITFSAFGYDNAQDVLRDADTAMYKAKSEGKARFAVFDASLHTAVSARLRLEGELRQAIAQGQLAVVYQPLFKLHASGPGQLAQNTLTGFEALVRWKHPGGDTLQPMAFLPIAEETGLMLQVSDFVLHCACRQLRQWQQSSPELAELTISINLSAHDLAHPALVARVSQAIVEAGLRPEHLTLELTEDILMSDISGAVVVLAALRRLGVRLAVDDFGTGYSSLSHLSRLPVDSLKIDRSFVHQLRRNSDDAAVVAAIVQLGSTLRKAVVAEGIETADQVDQLRELGCELGQGFHLAQPLTEQAAGDWLAARRAPLH
jgi:diguanylate cyclase (GGDEF)-like protein/PAS domain S-box-containing protein